MNRLLKKNGFLKRRIKDKNFFPFVKKIINKHFKYNDNYYSKLPIKKFHNIALSCQNEINKSNLDEKFFQSEKNFLKKMFPNDSVCISRIFTLRVVRPKKKVLSNSDNEQIGWHRETFYAKNKYVKHAMNIWFPISNISKRDNLHYIPKSHLIEDKKIKRKKFFPKNHNVKKFSASHKLGFPYHPKKITSGVNLRSSKSMNVKQNSYSIFSQMLIHGNSSNSNNKLRFAINTGMVATSKLKKNRKIDKRKFLIDSKNNTLYKKFSF